MSPKPQIQTLSTGLRLLVVPMPQLESTTVMVGVGAGSRFEAKPVNGLFHFLEHMAFKGTKKRPTTLAIATEVDSVGGEFNAFTDKEFTGYYLKLAAKHQELAFDILSDMLTNSLFKKEEIEREKGVIIEEINMYEDTPIRRVQEVFIRLLYGDNSMGWDIAGEKENIRRIKRADFLQYINQLYFPQNMTVVVAGKLDEAQAKKLTQQYFGGLKRNGQKKTQAIKLDQPAPQLKLATKKTEQAHFVLGVPGYQYDHPDRFALGLLATILGGGMSSRMWIQVRERRGLAYYVRTSPEIYTDSGLLMTQAGVDLNKIDEAIKVVGGEYQTIMIKPVGARELKKAKEFLKGRMVLALEDSQMVASRYAYQLLLEGKLRTPAETMALIDKVTAKDVQRVANDILRAEKMNLAIIGPYKDEGRFKKLLGGKA